MGVVYRGHDELLHRDVALKVVRKDADLDPAAGKNLLQEARASSSLAHPNICSVYEVGETNGELYIVMELVEGKSLRALIGQTRSSSVTKISVSPAAFRVPFPLEQKFRSSHPSALAEQGAVHDFSSPQYLIFTLNAPPLSL